jgi:hypothetical protein
LKKSIAETDQPAGTPTFDFQFSGALDCQRNACELGNPI